jgi:hypothetical protein
MKKIAMAILVSKLSINFRQFVKNIIKIEEENQTFVKIINYYYTDNKVVDKIKNMEYTCRNSSEAVKELESTRNKQRRLHETCVTNQTGKSTPGDL